MPLSHIIRDAKLGICDFEKFVSYKRFCSVFVRVFRVVLPIEFLPRRHQNTKKRSKELKEKT